MLAIATYATKGYCYAMGAQAPLVVAALRYAGIDPEKVVFIFAGDKSKEATAGFQEHERRLKLMGVKCEQLKLDEACNDNGNHVKESNLVIARLQNAAFDQARCLGAKQLWSLEADVLPQPNALRTLIDTLAFDRGWYDVAMCTYPNEAFLGGHGTPRNWILPNVAPDERDVPDDLRQWLDYRDRRRQRLAEAESYAFDRTSGTIKLVIGEQPGAEELDRWKEIDKALEECPPKGNVWELNAKRWRQRGWLDHAHPGMGLGGIVPVEWVGVGCTLLSERALHLANFTGYDGGCTQDLWLCWRGWHPAGIRLATVTHSICSHVKLRTVKVTEAKGGKEITREEKQPFIHHAHHELGGERHGHLNNHTKPWNGL